jgi:hypothetical protein
LQRLRRYEGAVVAAPVFEYVDKRPSTLVTLFVLAEAGTLFFFPIVALGQPEDPILSLLIGGFLLSGVCLPVLSLALWRSRRPLAITGLITFGLALCALIFRF